MAEEDWQYWIEQLLSHKKSFDTEEDFEFITVDQEVCAGEANHYVTLLELEQILTLNKEKRMKIEGDFKKCRVKLSFSWPKYLKLKSRIKIEERLEKPLILDSPCKESSVAFEYAKGVSWDSQCEEQRLFSDFAPEEKNAKTNLESILVPHALPLFTDTINFKSIPITVTLARHALLFGKFEAIPFCPIQREHPSFKRISGLTPSFRNHLKPKFTLHRDRPLEAPLPEPAIQQSNKAPLPEVAHSSSKIDKVRLIRGTILVNRTALRNREIGQWLESQKLAKVAERDFVEDLIFISSSPNCALIYTLAPWNDSICNSLSIISQMYPVVLLVYCLDNPISSFLNTIVGRFANIYPFQVGSIIEALNAFLEDNELELEEEPTAHERFLTIHQSCSHWSTQVAMTKSTLASLLKLP